jgi:hypothetical protein
MSNEAIKQLAEAVEHSIKLMAAYDGSERARRDRSTDGCSGSSSNRSICTCNDYFSVDR